MRLPVISWCLDFFSSLAWDSAINLVEAAQLGRHRWWWRLHGAAARQFWSDPPARVMDREAPDLGLPEGQCVYGETPVCTYLALMRRVGLGPEDVVVDLGCGRGLGLMGMCLATGARGVGVEIIPTFIERAERIGAAVGLQERVRWLRGNFLDQDLSEGTIFYAASTTFNREVMKELAYQLAELDNLRAAHGHGAPLRVITLSQPMPHPFRAVASQKYPMTWGWATVYFHELTWAASDEADGDDDAPDSDEPEA